MLQSIAGTYKDGVVQLTEAPANIQESKVIVTMSWVSLSLYPTYNFSTRSESINTL
jgi:hypothetical protein